MKKILIISLLLSLFSHNWAFAEYSQSISKKNSIMKKEPTVNIVLLSGETIMSRILTPEDLSEHMKNIIHIVFDEFYSKNYTSSIALEVTISPEKQSFRIGNKNSLSHKEKIALNRILKLLDQLPKVETTETIKFGIEFIV